MADLPWFLDFFSFSIEIEMHGCMDVKPRRWKNAGSGAIDRAPNRKCEGHVHGEVEGENTTPFEKKISFFSEQMTDVGAVFLLGVFCFKFAFD